jgi:hypothetical protein
MLRPLSFCSSDIFLSHLDFGLDHETLVSLGGALDESMDAPHIPLFGGVCTMLRSYWQRR